MRFHCISLFLEKKNRQKILFILRNEEKVLQISGMLLKLMSENLTIYFTHRQLNSQHFLPFNLLLLFTHLNYNTIKRIDARIIHLYPIFTIFTERNFE